MMHMGHFTNYTEDERLPRLKRTKNRELKREKERHFTVLG